MRHREVHVPAGVYLRRLPTRATLIGFGVMLALSMGLWRAPTASAVPETEVPGVVDAQVDVARTTLENLGLIVTTDPTEIPATVDRSQILVRLQNNNPDVDTGEVTEVLLTLGVRVPDLSGKSYSEAGAALTALELSGFVTQGDSEAESSIVVNQKPSAETLVGFNSEVALGLEAGIEVPDIVALSVDQARTAIEAAGLQFVPPSTRTDGVVASQDPLAGRFVSADSSVFATLTAPPLPSGGVVVPNVKRLTFEQSERLLQTLDLTLLAKGEADSEQALAIRQGPAPNTRVPVGSNVTVTFKVPVGTPDSSSWFDPWLWWLVGASLVVGAIATTGLLVHRAAKRTRQRRWAREHLHAHAHPSTDSRIRLDPTDGFQPLAVHLSPHSDPGQQSLEETLR